MNEPSILEKPAPRENRAPRPVKAAELVVKNAGSNVGEPVVKPAPSIAAKPVAQSSTRFTPVANKKWDEDDDGFWDRHRTKVILGAIFLVGGGVGAYVISTPGKVPPVRPKAPVMMVSLPPLPPPPPPPPPPKLPPPPEEPEQKMVEQTPVEEPEPKPEEPKPDDSPPPLGTALQGNGPPDGFGLSGSGGNGMLGGNGNGTRGGRGGSKYGWYAGQVQTRIAEALRKNNRTRSASLSVQVRIWADSNGRITRASLADSTGDAAVDGAIRNEILTGLQLQEPPPQDMPMPIVLRITARRPG